MGYSIKELFCSLQGEGYFTGRKAVFCRFSGCNLWSGRESDRASALCSICDTDFVGTDGPGGGRYQTAQALAQAVLATWEAQSPDETGERFVVLTGGEPLLQVGAGLLEEFHARGFFVAVETNGTRPLPIGSKGGCVDWVCVSPKPGTVLVLRGGDELKLLYPGEPPEQYAQLPFSHFYLQPVDGENRLENTAQAIQYCHRHPQWRLSIQTHKWLGIP